MSWLGSDKNTAETKVSRGPDIRSQGAATPVRRGPVIRTSDFAVRPMPEEPAPSPAEPVLSQAKVSPPPVDEHLSARAQVNEPAPAMPPQMEAGRETADAANVPLIDLWSIVVAVWANRRLVLALAVGGAVVGGGLMMTSSRKYTAETSLYFDPRQVQITRAAEGGENSTSAMSAQIDSQARILTSNRVMERVAAELELAKDPDFAVKAAPAADGSVPYALVARLQQATQIDRDDNTYVLSLRVTTGDGTKSATIANAIVEAYLAEENSAVAQLYRTANSALDGRLAELGAKVQSAEKAVEDFRTRNDMVTADGGLISDKRLVSLNDLLVTAQNKTIEAKARLDAASSLRVEDALVNNAGNDVTSATLVDLRRQYAGQAAGIASMESRLGPRHPALLAARGSLEGLKSEIRAELRRIASLAEAELEQARKAEQEVSKELGLQKALQSNTSLRQIELNELEREAAAAREIYETVLKRVRETSEDINLVRSNVRVISKAETPLTADGPGTKMLLIAGVVGGTILGFGLGAAFAIVRGLFSHPLVRTALRDFRRTTAKTRA